MSGQDHAAPRDSNNNPQPFGTSALFIGAIALGAVLGLSVPNADETFSQGIDATLLALIFLLFFELRLGATVKAFGNIRFLAIAWCANFLIIPVIGFGIASLFLSGDPLLFAGLMLYFLAPCTDWFLGFTRMANGDTELGAALIPINIITQLLLFPVWLWLFTKNTGLVDFTTMPDLLIQWFVLPLLAAQTLRFVFEKVVPSEAVDLIFRRTSQCVPFVLAALIVQIFAAHSGVLAIDFKVFTLLAVAVCLFFIATFLAGTGLSRLFRLDYPRRALLSMTMAARNAPLMLVLTAVAVPDQPLVLAAIVCGMLVEIPLLTALKQMLLNRNAK